MKVKKESWFKSLAVLIVILVHVGTASAENTSAIKLPKTGQVTCYDTTGNAKPCANTGQDGELQKGAAWSSPRFSANADTSITDNFTGLVWSPNGNLQPTRDPQWEKRGKTFEGVMTWQHALDYVAKLNTEKYLGHDDWRLPNFVELESLINRTQPDTAQWLNTLVFSNVQAGDYYWSSTSYVTDPTKAWVVDMSYGHIHYFDKATSHVVWPVRAGQ